MMNNRQNRAVLILFAVLAVLAVLLGLAGYRSLDRSKRKIDRTDGLTLLCPRLNACADAMILTNGEEAVMIDTGVKKDGALLLKLLRERGISRLDAMILTHFDKDHIGGAAAILREVEVECCYVTAGKEESKEYAALLEALEGRQIRTVVVTEKEHINVFESEITIYPPLTDTFEKSQDNNLSLITSVAGQGYSLLFAGDAEKDRVNQYLEEQYDGTSFRFLKVPHHGRDKKTVRKMLKYFIPETAVICSSDEEPEDPECVRELEDAGVRVLLTREGDQELYFSEEGESGKPDETDTEAEPARTETSIVKPPELSVPAGFYDEEFSVTIQSAPGTKVYYSLDCSLPGPDSIPYDKAVRITDLAKEADIYSKRVDFWPYLPGDYYPYHTLLEPGWYSRFILPDHVDHCRVIRAVAVDGEGNVSPAVTASYFIGYKDKKGYDKLPILSLTSDPEDLFSDEKGIMVNGKTYREKWEMGDLDGIANSHKVREYCNTYKGRGKDWERKVHIDYFEGGKKKLVFSQEAGIRLHGNQSRVAESQKSFNLYARKSYDGNKVFKTAFFEDGLLTDKITLMRGSDLRNYYLSEKMNGRAMYTQKYKMAQVFLDGEYWGLYAIQERYNSDTFLETHYNLEKEDYTLAKGTPTGFEIKNGDQDAIRTSFRMVRSFAANNDLSEESNYRTLCSMMDMDSFIDAYAAKIYTGDQDWSWFKNQYLIFFDHRWHWMTYDIDYGAGGHDDAMEDVDTFSTTRMIAAYSLANDPLFPHLMKSDAFRRDFVNAFLDLGNETFKGETVEREMKAFAGKYREEGRLESLRYPTPDSDGSGLADNEIEESCRQVGRYFSRRREYAFRYLASYFHLKGKPVTLTLENPDPAGGKIRLNTIEPVPDQEGRWTGIYYTDYPVILTALPCEGYIFAGWKCEGGVLADAKAPVTEASLDKNAKVTAIFRQQEEKNDQ